jgi:GT2 family glycosyltransferase
VRHLVVVVDGEDPESIAVLSSLQSHDDRLIFEQVAPSGQLHALAVGATLTDAEVVLLLDDDVFPTPGMIAGHARGHLDEQGLVLVGTMPVQLPPNNADIGSLLYARDYLNHLARIATGEHEVLEWLWLGNVSIRRADCLCVGLHSERFTASYHNDRDLGYRLAEAGLKGRYDPSLIAAHRHRRNKRAFLRDARHRGAGLVQLHAVHRHMGLFDPAVFTEGLPAPVATAVRRIGSTGAAPFVARGLLEVGSGLGALGWKTGRNNLAKLSRRLMFLWGATAGEGPVQPAAPHVM